MAGGGGNSESGEPEFQIAPMIDVLLVLLIFFMSITSAEVLKIDKDIHLPVSPDAPKKENKPGANFGEGALNVKWKENKATVNFESKNYDDMPALVDVLQKRKAKMDTYKIIIRADKNTPMVEINKVMNVLGNAGLDNIALSTLNKDDSPETPTP